METISNLAWASRLREIFAWVGLVWACGIAGASPVGSAWTYRGQLEDNGVPATGQYDLTFSLYGNATGGTPVSVTYTNLGVSVTGGSFEVTVDFGTTPFNGTALWIEAAMRTNGATSPFATLVPRSTLEIVPFAAYALNSITPAQFSTVIGALSAGWRSDLLNTSNALSSPVTGRLPANNGLGSGLTLVQSNYTSAFPLTIAGPDEGTNTHGFTLGNGYSYQYNLYNGTPYPIAVFRPTQKGASMPFDLMPNGTNATVWMDLCSVDLWDDASSVEYLRLRKYGVADGGYAEITTGAWGNGKITPLLIQPYGGQVGIGYFRKDIQPRYQVQFRTGRDINLGFRTANGAMSMVSADDSGADAPLTLNASSFVLGGTTTSTPALVLTNNILSTPAIVAETLIAGAATISNLTVTSFTFLPPIVNPSNSTNPTASSFGTFSVAGGGGGGGSNPNILFNSTNGDLWIDLSNDAGNGGFLRMKETSSAVGGYAEIASGFGNHTGIGNLLIQPAGGNVGIGRFDSLFQPTLPFQLRPATNNNLGVYSLFGTTTLASFSDDHKGAPLILQGSSMSVTTDGGISRPLTVSNNLVTATSLVVTDTTSVGNLTARNFIIPNATGSITANTANLTNLTVNNFSAKPLGSATLVGTNPGVSLSSTNGDVWLDLAGDGAAGGVLRLKQRSIANGGYSEITAGRLWTPGQLGNGNLVFQPLGGNVGIGKFSAAFPPTLPFQLHPITDNNLGAYSLKGTMTLASFTDLHQSAALQLQGSSITVTTDGGISQAFTVSNNIVNAGSIVSATISAGTQTVSNLVATTSASMATVGIGTSPGNSYVFAVAATNRASLPWPRMARGNRDGLPAVEGGATVYSFENRQPEWADGKGNWYRFGQRPTVSVVGGLATNVVPVNVDVILVKGKSPTTIVLPSATDFTWRKITVKDISGKANTNPVVVASLAGNVEAGSNYSINSNYGNATFVSDGTDWWRIE